jgi:hypothetical protein
MDIPLFPKATLEHLLHRHLLHLKAPLAKVLEKTPPAVPRRNGLDVPLAFHAGAGKAQLDDDDGRRAGRAGSEDDVGV